MKRILQSVFIALLLLAGNISLFAQKGTVDAEGHAWWQHAVFYEVYPRSFADSDNDGIGDIKGITSKLDYLKELGVDALWITPCFPSPQVDFGYDVSDYENVSPEYGTLADMDQLIAEGKKRGIRILLDLVMNHTSDQHPWFVDSRSSLAAAHRDWYVWRDGKGAGQPPNNWIAAFGGSAWQWDPKTSQYYYHNYYPQQPDLNWRNPEVEKAIFDVTRFWYKRGIAGFRLDAVNAMFEDPQLRDNPVLPGKNAYGDPLTERKYNSSFPEVHDVLKRLRSVANEYDAVLVGEASARDVSLLKAFYGEHNDELQMPMDLLFGAIKPLSADKFRSHVAALEAAGGWPVYLFSNHDRQRQYDSYGGGRNNDAIAKLLAGFYLTLRGSVIMYYGEEIGMHNNDPQRIEDVKDPIGKLGWPKNKGRDGERTPMQWSSSANAGFSQVAPWLPVPSDYPTRNAAVEAKDPNSILNFYKRVLALRHDNPALREGNYVALNESDPNVLAYLRPYRGSAVLVVLNMTDKNQQVGFDLKAQGFEQAKLAGLLSSLPKLPAKKIAQMDLAPFEVYIAQLTK